LERACPDLAGDGDGLGEVPSRLGGATLLGVDVRHRDQRFAPKV
jgi:hypothetical protein